jgi:tetratricopeptide (TPR) repeat protein
VKARVLVLLLCSTIARRAAAEQPTEQQARLHYNLGGVRYAAGDYRGAVREFEAGYRLLPLAKFLINIGQAYRKLGDLGAAREAFARFLVEAGPSDSYRREAQNMVADLDARLAAAPPAPHAKVLADEPPHTAPTTTARPSPLRRAWWAIPVAVLVVAGAALAIYFAASAGSSPDGCALPSSALGCVDLRR